jgi:hypothetical protein
MVKVYYTVKLTSIGKKKYSGLYTETEASPWNKSWVHALNERKKRLGSGY